MQPLEQPLEVGVGAPNAAENLVELFLSIARSVPFLRGLQASIVEKWRQGPYERGAERGDLLEARAKLGGLEHERSVEPALLLVEPGAQGLHLRDSAIERVLTVIVYPACEPQVAQA